MTDKQRIGLMANEKQIRLYRTMNAQMQLGGFAFARRAALELLFEIADNLNAINTYIYDEIQDVLKKTAHV